MSNIEIAKLRDELERVAQERDNLAQSYANGAAAYIAQGRELTEAKAALERQTAACKVHRDRASADAMQEAVECQAALDELTQLRRAWALRELNRVRHDLPGYGPRSQPIADVCFGLPESVAALIRAGAGHSLAKCALCEKMAPVVMRVLPHVEGSLRTTIPVCAPAWGCSEKGASDG